MPALKGKKEKFACEYIVDYNATQAAVRAGFSEKSAANAGYRMLKNDEVAARVRELQKIYNEERCFDEKERVLKELWETFEHASAATEVMEWDRDEHRYIPTGEYTFDGKTATKALELIAKMNGMLTENVNNNISAGSDSVEFKIKVVSADGD